MILFVYIIEMMAKKYFPITLLLILFLHILGWGFSPYFSIPPLLKEYKNPLWWDIKIKLITDGEYKMKQKNTSYLGDYSFTIVWSGSMEIDKDRDYLLYHEECALVDWKAKEKKMFSDSTQIKSEKDFKKKPSFHLNYILRKKENLCFYFTVDGFPVPQNESVTKLCLPMPCSDEHLDYPSLTTYESSIVEGSNRIFLEEKEIYAASVDREFTWKWKRHDWSPDPKGPALLTNLHRVKVKISIEPHY